MSDREARASATDDALCEVYDEVMRTVAKFPPFNSPHEGYAVIAEELDELWDEVKADRPDKAVEEAVQVAAMAVRFITDMAERAKRAQERGE